MKLHWRVFRQLGVSVPALGAFLILLVSSVALFSSPQDLERADRSPDRSGPSHGNRPIQPFKIIGNIYYVGLSDQTSYLITTPQGHFLIDATWEGGVPEIRKSIEQLGFKIKDVKYLLNAHAHDDHVEGMAAMKELTGGKVLVMDGDVAAISTGVTERSQGGKPQWRPVRVDQTLRDGEQIRLGGVTMTAYRTAGHTKGCTTWSTVAEEKGRQYNVVFLCSMRVSPGLALVGNPSYPNIVEDFETAFAKLKSLPGEVFLASHGNQYGMAEKIKRLEQNPAVNPFIDPQGYKDYIARYEAAFREELQKQRAAAKQ